MRAGDTYRQHHLWVVISDPSANPDCVLVVNLTSVRQHSDISDLTCVLDLGDHECITHRSYVNYGRAKVFTNRELDRLTSSGTFSPKDSLADELLLRIREGAAASDRISIDNRQLLIDQGLVVDPDA